MERIGIYYCRECMDYWEATGHMFCDNCGHDAFVDEAYVAYTDFGELPLAWMMLYTENGERIML